MLVFTDLSFCIGNVMSQNGSHQGKDCLTVNFISWNTQQVQQNLASSSTFSSDMLKVLEGFDSLSAAAWM